MFCYFLTLGLHMILIGFHLLFGWGCSVQFSCSEGVLLVKIWSNSLAKWIIENPKRGKVLLGTVLFVTEGVVFAFFEVSFLVSAFHIEHESELA